MPVLKALYDYAQRMNLTLPAGYAEKTIKAFLCLTGDGHFVGVRMDGVNPFCCPDIGSLANGTDKSNLLVEKYSVVFPLESTPKSRFFRDGLNDLGTVEPLANVCVKALEDPQCCADMTAALEQHKVKPTDRVSFQVDNTYLVECPTVKTWWQTYRQRFQKPIKGDELSRCLITGQSTVPIATVPKTTGLAVVGGHSSGDALICFDKPAFCSYGLKKSANAPVSEEAFAQVKAALDTLLKDAPPLAGMKFVHWYDKPLPKETPDPLPPIFGNMLSEDDEENEEESLSSESEQVIIQQARRDADALVQSVETGQTVTDLPNRYYILLLSGAGGRVMIRQFSQGSYEELKANLDQWYADLQLVNRYGTRNLKPVKLAARLIRLLKRQNNNKKVFERLRDELPGLTTPVFYAILHGTQLPDSVAVRALQNIRSQMLTEEPDGKGLMVPDPISCQWLKVWLIRTQKEAYLMPEYNPQHPSPAYQIGAMVAVYAALQQRAYPDVNVTVVQRFFASAQQTPALVLGRLAKMSTHHLAKLERRVANVYETRLADISARIGDRVPTVLSLPEQSLFALGYYQMTAAMNQERRERFDKTADFGDENEEE